MNFKLSLKVNFHLKLISFFIFFVFMAAQTGKNPYGNGDYLETKRGKIYFETEGKGIPLILVNGGPGAGHTVFWGRFSFLKELGYQIVYFDGIGRGRSDRKTDGRFSPHSDAEEIELLRKHLGAEKIVLMGHSYGGIPAILYAIKYKNRVKKLIMANPSYDEASHQMNIDHAKHLAKVHYPEIWDTMMQMREEGILSTNDQYGRLLSRVIDSHYWNKLENRSKLNLYWSSDKRDRFNYKVYTDIIGDDPEWKVSGTLAGVQIETDLKQLLTPTLIIGGRHDGLSTPQMIYRLYKMFPPSVAKLSFFEHSGHWPWVEEEKLFQYELKEFLKD